jgi:uncharacterized protein (DUF1697 family)
MADLRDLIADLGYSEVETLLNSGNAVFSTPEGAVASQVAGRIREALETHLAVRANVIVVTASHLGAAIVQNPLADEADDPSRLLIAFLADPADRPRLATMEAHDWTPEAFAVGERVAYLWCPRGVADSALFRALGQALGDRATARNWATVLKLRALADGVS